MGTDTVSADADNLGVSFLKFGIEVAKLQAFGGAARRIVFGIEVQHQILAAVLG